MKQFTFMEEFESEVNDVFESLWSDYMDTVTIMGDRPYGSISGSRWEQVEQYIELRDDPARWTQQLEEWAAVSGRETAEITAISEATRLERLIADMGGYEACRLGIFARRLRTVEPAMQAARRIQDMPKATVLPPLAPLNEIDLLARFTSQPDAIEGELA